MPVELPFIGTCPLLLDNDRLCLNGSLSLQGKTLLDNCTRAKHILHAPSQKLVHTLLNDCTVSELRAHARLLGIHDSQLNDFIGFLNMTGGLRRIRSRFALRTGYHYATGLLMGIHYAPLSWRQHYRPLLLAKGCLRAAWPIVAATLAVCVEISISGLLPFRTAITISSIGAFAFMVSLYVHEFVHAYIIKQQGVQPNILQRHMRLGLIHESLSPHAELKSALAGPVAGGGVGLLVAALFMHHSYLISLLSVCIAFFHFFSLLPWYGDGKSIRQALSAIKEERIKHEIYITAW